MPQTDTKRKPRKARKNKSLELLRAITKSMAGAIPGLDDDTRETIDDSLARPVSGLMSQVMGEDDDGNLVFPPLHNMQRAWNADDRRKRGLPRERQVMPGLIQDTVSLPAMFGGGPEMSQDAAESAGRLHSGVDESMGLDAPQGFRQNALNSLGMMAGQLPVPGKAKVDAARQMGSGALQMAKHYGAKALKSPIEFLSPTVQPSPSNYAMGAVGGGALSALGENPGMIAQLFSGMGNTPIPEDPRIPRVRPRKLENINYDDLPAVSQLAKGGKAGALKQMLKAVNVSPDQKYMIGEPVEEVLYAVNEGTRKGVLSTEEAVEIKRQLAEGEEDELADSLLKLHERLFPKPPMVPVDKQAMPVLSVPDKPNPYGISEPERIARGAGMTQEEWDAMIQRHSAKKATGGKVKTARRGILGILEAASKAGVPQGNELVPTPTSTDLPVESVGDQLEKLNLKLSSQEPTSQRSLADMPVSRRTVLKGAAGALMPDLPISPEAIATQIVTKAAKELPDAIQKGVSAPAPLVFDQAEMVDHFTEYPYTARKLQIDPSELLGEDPEGELTQYLSAVTPKFQEFLRGKGMYLDDDMRFHYDPSKRDEIMEEVKKILDEYDSEDEIGTTWKKYDLSGDDDVDYNGSYVHNMVDILDHMAASKLKYSIFGNEDYGSNLDEIEKLIDSFGERGQPVKPLLKAVLDFESDPKTDFMDEDYRQAWIRLEDEIDSLTSVKSPHPEVGEIPGYEAITSRLDLKGKDKKLFDELTKKLGGPEGIEAEFERYFTTDGNTDLTKLLMSKKYRSLGELINHSLEPIYIDHTPQSRYDPPMLDEE